MDPKYVVQGKDCAICSICAICFADGPIPDFEGVGLYGLFGLF
ncbi:subtilosin A family bacteriocin [Pyrococcus sp.]|nr:subtilosin A family bacteriocin [Pyrococcus sp.]